ncbi:hypothetical protein ACROYT_G044162 [Oculina patagonica]
MPGVLNHIKRKRVRVLTDTTHFPKGLYLHPGTRGNINPSSLMQFTSGPTISIRVISVLNIKLVEISSHKLNQIMTLISFFPCSNGIRD